MENNIYANLAISANDIQILRECLEISLALLGDFDFDSIQNNFAKILPLKKQIITISKTSDLVSFLDSQYQIACIDGETWSEQRQPSQLNNDTLFTHLNTRSN